MSERTYAQGLQDDEDHRLALCGLAPDVRLDWELEDQLSRFHDFEFFASGRRDPAPTMRSGLAAGRKRHNPRRSAASPPPLSTS